MVALLLILLSTLGLSGSRADTSVSDYIFWKKADINAWHGFFPSRALQQERMTNQAAVAAVNAVSAGLNDSLAAILVFQAQELATAQMLMAGTNAEGCIKGIASFVDQAIADEISAYEDCTADALSKLKRISNKLDTVILHYLTAYQKALKGIDTCARTYPNKNSIDRLRSCVESMNSGYFAAATYANNSVWPSPSMTYFTDVVVGCASDAANNMGDVGTKFLQMLVECAELGDGAIDPASYQEELSQWQGYQDNLTSQVSAAQNKSLLQVLNVESQMLFYYDLQKQALEKYVIETRGLGNYYSQLYYYLRQYYNTVTATLIDNPSSSVCQSAALNLLDTAVRQAAEASYQCDQDIVADTRQLINETVSNFSYLNDLLPEIGNVAILFCFNQGFIFAPKTISNCATLVHTEFDIVSSERYATISKAVATISAYESHLSSTVFTPCGAFSLRKVLLSGDIALYKLQRCLYISSGTNYEVTTPAA